LPPPAWHGSSGDDDDQVILNTLPNAANALATKEVISEATIP